MIPLKLNVKNFLCYRENVPTLDFSGIHVACLCGANGHGKSALLDAITWSIWGRSRAPNLDDLIYYGADEARVELEFLARDTEYRVIRSHSRGRGRGRPGTTDLQLQILNDGGAQSVSGNTVRETQAKIEQIVGMDYDTFINSAFLLQGRADEFTSKTPAERKAVLASVLGLDIYDRLQSRAREKVSEGRAAIDRSSGGLQQIHRDIEEIGDPSEELTGVAKYVTEVESRLAGQRAAVEAIRGRVAQLGHQREEMDALKRQIQSSRQDLTQLDARASTAQERIKQFESIIQQGPEIESGLKKLKEAQRRYESLEQSRQKFDSLNQDKWAVDQEISNKRVRLESHLENLKRRVAQELSPKAEAQAQLQQQIVEVQHRLEELSQQDQKLTQQRNQQQDLATKIGEYQSLADRYGAEGQEVGQKLKLLQNRGDDQAECPVCQTPLGQDGCQRLEESYQADIETKRGHYRQNQALLKKLEQEQSILAEALPKQEQELAKSRQQAQVRSSELDRQIEESKLAQQELVKIAPEVTAAELALTSGEFASQENHRLKELVQEIESLGYDETERQLRYTEIGQLQGFEGKQVQLSQAVTGLPSEAETLAQAQDMLQRRQQDLAEQETRLKANEAALVELPALESQLTGIDRSVAELEDSRESALRRRGLLEGQVGRLEELRQAISDSASRLQTLEEELGIYQELATAFGRQGIQAMLIETVVPHLENEANLLLGRMTDNRMHLKLETQRERRTGRGEPIETLEINVSDELGPRSYEMYSGGEAFRVNLALRIALSKVLAQRMGAPLPTLFIDEGFGTQDTAGRERILDVISSIQDDFDKIIVITHLDDLKDMFPVRIEVQKDANGSTFWLS